MSWIETQWGAPVPQTKRTSDTDRLAKRLTGNTTKKAPKPKKDTKKAQDPHEWAYQKLLEEGRIPDGMTKAEAIRLAKNGGLPAKKGGGGFLPEPGTKPTRRTGRPAHHGYVGGGENPYDPNTSNYRGTSGVRQGGQSLGGVRSIDEYRATAQNLLGTDTGYIDAVRGAYDQLLGGFAGRGEFLDEMVQGQSQSLLDALNRVRNDDTQERLRDWALEEARRQESAGIGSIGVAFDPAEARTREAIANLLSQGREAGERQAGIYNDAAAGVRANNEAVASQYADNYGALGVTGPVNGVAVDVESLLSAAAPREQVLAEQLASIASQGQEYLLGSLGQQEAAQKGDLIRMAAGEKARIGAEFTKRESAEQQRAAELYDQRAYELSQMANDRQFQMMSDYDQAAFEGAREVAGIGYEQNNRLRELAAEMALGDRNWSREWEAEQVRHDRDIATQLELDRIAREGEAGLSYGPIGDHATSVAERARQVPGGNITWTEPNKDGVEELVEVPAGLVVSQWEENAQLIAATATSREDAQRKWTAWYRTIAAEYPDTMKALQRIPGMSDPYAATDTMFGPAD